MTWKLFQAGSQKVEALELSLCWGGELHLSASLDRSRCGYLASAQKSSLLWFPLPKDAQSCAQKLQAPPLQWRWSLVPWGSDWIAISWLVPDFFFGGLVRHTSRFVKQLSFFLMTILLLWPSLRPDVSTAGSYRSSPVLKFLEDEAVLARILDNGRDMLPLEHQDGKGWIWAFSCKTRRDFESSPEFAQVTLQ